MKPLTRHAIAIAAAAATLAAGGIVPLAFADQPSARDTLQALVAQDTVANFKAQKPLPIGGENGTAPYSQATPSAAGLKKLQDTLAIAQKQLGDSSTSDADLISTAADLRAAFDSPYVYAYTGISGTDGSKMFDTNGTQIQAHGAGIVRVPVSSLPASERSIDQNHDGYVYIWCGEDKTNKLVARGVHIYSSDDLLNWTDHGLGLQTFNGEKDFAARQADPKSVYHDYTVDSIKSDPDYTHIYGADFKAFANDPANYNIDSPQKALTLLKWDLDTTEKCVFERPKIAYNAKTNRWVLWFHSDGPKYPNPNLATYSKAKAGVAIGEPGAGPFGPYKYLGSFRMSPGTNTGNPGMARDMNLYVDDKDADHDGVDDAYLLYASNENRDLTISRLDGTYTKLAQPQKQGTDSSATYSIAATDSKEAPAPFKWNGRYYIIYSGTTGWAPNENKYAISAGDNILGPYTEQGSPFIAGSGSNQSPSNTYKTQSSTIIPVDPAKGEFIYWGDRWYNPDTGNDISQSRYVMVPMHMSGNKLSVYPRANWSLSEMGRYQAVNFDDRQLTKTSDSMSDLLKSLPKTVKVTVGDSTTPIETPVTWSYRGPDIPTGTATVTGTLPNLNDAQISFDATIYSKDIVLFMDLGSDASNESDYYKALIKNDPNLINKNHSDQAYSAGQKNAWGIASSVGANGDVQKYGTSSTDINETGYYANKGKSIVYKADLPAGKYQATPGYKEWWTPWNNRRVKFTVSANGKDLGSVQFKSAEGGNSASPVSFTLKKAATVTFTAGRGDGEGSDPVLSWISISCVDPKSVDTVDNPTAMTAIVDGEEAKLPKTIAITLGDGTAEKRNVTWDSTGSGSAAKDFMAEKIQGSVEGTTLPAELTVIHVPQDLEYYIDAHGAGNSPAFDGISKAVKLRNDAADQKVDTGASVVWGNATDQSGYGTHDASTGDPFDTGIYDSTGHDGDGGNGLSYVLTLAPGHHRLFLGFKDWWYQSRPTTVMATMDKPTDGAAAHDSAGITDTIRLGQISNVDAGGGDPNIQTLDITVPGTKDAHVTLNVKSTQGSGAILSWIAAEKLVTADEHDAAVERLRTALDKNGTLDEPTYGKLAGWPAYSAALQNGRNLATDGTATADTIDKAIAALSAAHDALIRQKKDQDNTKPSKPEHGNGTDGTKPSQPSHPSTPSQQGKQARGSSSAEAAAKKNAARHNTGLAKTGSAVMAIAALALLAIAGGIALVSAHSKGHRADR